MADDVHRLQIGISTCSCVTWPIVLEGALPLHCLFASTTCRRCLQVPPPPSVRQPFSDGVCQPPPHSRASCGSPRRHQGTQPIDPMPSPKEREGATRQYHKGTPYHTTPCHNPSWASCVPSPRLRGPQEVAHPQFRQRHASLFRLWDVMREGLLPQVVTRLRGLKSSGPPPFSAGAAAACHRCPRASGILDPFLTSSHPTLALARVAK